MNTIILRDFSLATASAADEARSQRDLLIQRYQTIPSIVDTESARHATNLLRELRDFYKVIEAARKEVKAPVLKLEREIDALAEELDGQVEVAGRKLSTLLGAYDLEQKRIAEEKRIEAQREERRIRDEAARVEREEEERQAKLRDQARREVERQQKEIAFAAEAKAARARTEAGRERAAQEAERLRLELEDKALREAQELERVALEQQKVRDDEEARKVAATRESAFALTANKPKDTSTSEVIKFEVTDIVALYEAAPYLVRLEPNVAALKSALKGLHGDQKLPGVKHWFEATTITRG